MSSALLLTILSAWSLAMSATTCHGVTQCFLAVQGCHESRVSWGKQLKVDDMALSALICFVCRATFSPWFQGKPNSGCHATTIWVVHGPLV